MVDTQSAVALATIGVYIVIVLALGYQGWRVGKVSVEDWMTASRGLGIVVLLFTYAATYHSAFAFLGASGFMYENGIGLLLAATGFLVMSGLIFWVLGSRIWLLGKKHGYITPADLLRDFYNSRILGLFASLVLILFTFPYVALQLMGGGIIFETATGGLVSFEVGAAVLLAVGVIYVWLGGMRSIAWTDTVQGVFMILAVWIAAAFFLASTYHGPAEFLTELTLSFEEHVTLPGPEGTMQPVWYTSYALMIGLGMMMSPHIFLRYFSAKSPTTIKSVAVGGTAYLIGFYIILPIFAFAAVTHFPDLADPDSAVPAVLYEFTPVWFASIVVAGALAAAMSTKDAQMHAVSVLITRDWYEEFTDDVDSRTETRLAQVLIPILGVISYVFAIQDFGLLAIVLSMALDGTAQLMPLVVGALFWSRATTEGAFAGIVSGVTVTAVLYLGVVSVPAILPEAVPGFYGLILNVTLFVGVSLLTDPVPTANRDRVQGYIAYARERGWQTDANVPADD
ncbi:sodium:solute symporter family protein [Natrononativus amylolyticus]|uniref:sodium:solute symporter family protein n=1 Tax=Natrononativus amylolyticus TaxID=2963434 RepID=UPI0020CBCDF0|nr:sodium:solute symporter family protein [Natrononativus amylolyticus]